MLIMIFTSIITLFTFIYITIFCLPIVYFIKDEHKKVLFGRKCLYKVAKAILFGTGTKVKSIYKDKAEIDNLNPNVGIVYVCNHQSNLDIPSLIEAIGYNVGFVAKKEMKSWPFYGIWMTISNCIFLDRTNPREGLKDIKKAVEIIKKGYPTLIFPEGERSLTGEIGTFKKGSFKLAIDTNGVIVPITVKGTYDIQKRGEKRMKYGKTVTIIFDKPIFINEMSKENIKTLDEKVKNIIVENFNNKELI